MSANVNRGNINRAVVARATSTRARPADFPGWDAPDAADRLVPITAGTRGRVTSVESHGSNPWTRYAVEFEDGSRAAGLVPGHDFDWA